MTGDATQLLFRDQEFDVVLTSKTMHHIPSWEAALMEMVRVLKPGGYLTYVDLAFPGWVAALGNNLLTVMGFPTARGLETFVEKNHLHKIHSAKSFMSYKLICRK